MRKLIAIFLTILTIGVISITFFLNNEKEPIKVGILHSQTGTMAISEKGVIDATLLAIEEINRNGGVLGRELKPIIEDGESNPTIFREKARKLIQKDEVSVIFGCWTSSSRKAVKSVVEEFNNLLFYPVQYEGVEESKNIIYTGLSANQQLIPAVKYAIDNLGDSLFLVGSNYVFPKIANTVMRDTIEFLNAKVLAEEYIPLGSKGLKDIISKIKFHKPEVILNTINGDSNLAFFKALKGDDELKDIPTISFSITETEMQDFSKEIDIHKFKNDYLSWSYFESIDSKSNLEFVKKFKTKFGEDYRVTDPMEAGYYGVKLWARVAQIENSFKPEVLNQKMQKSSIKAQSGIFYIDNNNHTWKSVKIAKIDSNLTFKIMWDSLNPIRPIPFLRYKSKDEWEKILKECS